MMTTFSNRPVVLLLAIVGLLAYHLPWVAAPSANLSLAGYDFAEWTSLHPLVRAGSPPLATTLLLRLPLTLLALGLAYNYESTTKPQLRWISAALFLLIIGRLSPPVEFLTIATDDPNYRQQLLLALFTAIAGVIGLLAPLPRRNRAYLIMVVASLGAAASIIGLLRAQSLFNNFAVETRLGAGAMVTIIAFIIIAAKQVDSLRRYNIKRDSVKDGAISLESTK